MHAETVKLAMDCLAVLIENVNDQNSLSKDEEITNTIILSLFNLLRSPGLVSILNGKENRHNTHDTLNRSYSNTSNYNDLAANNITPNNNLRASIFRLIALLSDKNYIYANKIIKRALSYVSSTNWSKIGEANPKNSDTDSNNNPSSNSQETANANNLNLLSDFLAVIGTSCLVSDVEHEKDLYKLKKKCIEIIDNFDNETVWLRALEILAITGFDPGIELKSIIDSDRMKFKLSAKLQNRINTRFSLIENHPPILDIDFTPKLPKKAILASLNSRLSNSVSNTSISSQETITNQSLAQNESENSLATKSSSSISSKESGLPLQSREQPKRFHSAGKSRGNNTRLPWTKASGASSKATSSATSKESLIIAKGMKINLE